MSDCEFQKHDDGKVRPTLLSLPALNATLDVLEIGARKYSADNWRKGADWSRYYNALLRHLFAYWSGEDNDPETGRLHLAHASCCLQFLLDYQILGRGTDDRVQEAELVDEPDLPIAAPYRCSRCPATSDDACLSNTPDGILCGPCGGDE